MGKRNWSVNHSTIAATRWKAPLPCACIIATELTDTHIFRRNIVPFHPQNSLLREQTIAPRSFGGFHFSETSPDVSVLTVDSVCR